MNASSNHQAEKSVIIATQPVYANDTLSQNAPNNDKQDEVNQSILSDRNKIEDKITGIVAKQLGIESQSVDVYSPLVIASEIDVIEIIMGIKEAFNIDIKDEEVDKEISQSSLTVKKLADIVSKKKNP
jgi:acyl carrier protein